MKKRSKKTPVRSALRAESALLPLVKNGMEAVQKKDRALFDTTIRLAFSDSLELDDAVKLGREQENRWDYLLGHDPSGDVVAIEPHSAKTDEITTVIKKKSAAREQLKAHLAEGKRVTRWLWVASGKVHFADTEKTRRLLDQQGIQFVAPRVAAKHLL